MQGSHRNQDLQYKYSSLSEKDQDRPKASRVPLTWILLITLIATLVVGGGFSFIFDRERRDKSSHGFFPEIPYKKVPFDRDERFYTANPGDPDGSPWEELNPIGQGWVIVPDWKERGLVQGLGTAYQISMFHQLHCLAHLKRTTMALYSIVNNNLAAEELEAAKNLTLHQEGHVDHCIELLRQYVMCAGDTALEPFTSSNLGLSGTVHTCRDWDFIMRLGEDYRARNKSGILE